MKLNISTSVGHKLTSRHGVSEEDIRQCFANRNSRMLKDIRAKHDTQPPTMWFISETDFGRKLKVVFIQERDGSITIKTAYEPNSDEIRIYDKYGRDGSLEK